MRAEVIKIGEYDPTFNGRFERYEGLCLSASNETDPPLTENAATDLQLAAESLNGTTIFHSTLLRGEHSAKILQATKSVPIYPNPYLNEIPFSLESLATKEEYEAQRSVRVREQFVHAFVEDTLLEPRESILERVDQISQLIVSNDSPAITLVSHSFLMKVLEAALNGVPLSENPELLANWVRPEESTYKFAKGFTIDSK